MSTLEQIVACFIGLVITGEVTAIILLFIHIHRESHEKPDTAAQERAALKQGQRTLLDRIEQMQSQRAINYFVFDHTRNEIIEQADALVTLRGGVRVTGEPLKIDQKFFDREVRLLVILKDGEEAEIF